MLEIREGTYNGHTISIFWVTQGVEPIGEVITTVKSRMAERFRCGDQPTAGHSPLLGKVAFIRTALFQHPAALVALTNELSSLFDAICVQVSPDTYVASVVKEGSQCGCKLGMAIPASEVKDHIDPWRKGDA
jgi:hypothetical protein